MGFLFPLLMVGIPLLDLASLIAIGGELGVLRTLALLLLAMILGIALVRWQGLAVGREARASLAAGRLPVAAGFDSLCLLVAGGLFILPGFVSDALALLLLVPPVRFGLRLLLGRTLIKGATARSWPAETSGNAPGREAGTGVVIEGEVIRADHAETGDGSASRPAPRLAFHDPEAPPANPGSGPARDRRGVVPPDDPC